MDELSQTVQSNMKVLSLDMKKIGVKIDNIDKLL